MAVHHCAGFWNNPRLVHKRAVRKIEQYLTSKFTYVDLSNENWRVTMIGVVYNPSIEIGIECYVDADFSGGWDQAYANNA